MSYEKYKKVFDQYNGVLKTSDFTDAGYHHDILDKLIKEDKIIKIRTGYYEWQGETVISDAVIIKKLYPDAITCMNSALYLYDYIDRTPNAWHLAVSKNISKDRFKINYPKLNIYYVIDKYLKIGISQYIYEGHEIKIYDRERVVCDAIRYEKKMDKEIFNKTIRSYINDPEQRITKLMEYAKLMNIEKKTKMVIGMWM